MADFSVSFCLSRELALNALRPYSVVAWPVDKNWNDFGYGFQAKLRAQAAASQPGIALDLLIVPGTNEPRSERFDRWLEALQPATGVVAAETLGTRFLSILRSEQEYRNLVEWAARSQVDVASVLSPLRDIVQFRALLRETDALTVFLATEAAHNGVFRREPTFLAWHRGVRILTGAGIGEVEDARTEFSFESRLSGFSGPHSITISFGVPAPLSDRCHALIGKNGVGKSEFLREFIVTLGRKIDGTQTDPFTSDGAPHGETSSVQPGTFAVNRVLALSWDAQSRFPPGARLNSPFQYLHFTMRDDEFEPAERARTGDSDTLASQLLQLLREDLGQVGSGLDRLKTTLRPLFNVNDLALAFRPEGNAGAPAWASLRQIRGMFEQRQLELFGRLEAGLPPKIWREDHGAVDLSSGERAFLNFGIRCAARVVPGTLLVLDEPETHLHPNLIADFMRVLTALLLSTKSIALIATHSPFVIRELPGRCVHVVQVDDERSPSVASAFLRTFGASVDALAADIFQDADSSQVNTEVATQIAQSGLSFDEVLERYGREVSADLLSEIRQLMRDAVA